MGDLVALAERAAGGRANLLVVLSADHGGAAVPEHWAASGVDEETPAVKTNAETMAATDVLIRKDLVIAQ